MVPGKVQGNKPDHYAHLPKNVASSLRKANEVEQTEHGYKWSVHRGRDYSETSGKVIDRYTDYIYDSRLGDKVWAVGYRGGKFHIPTRGAYNDAVEKYETEQEYARQKAEAEAERARQQAIIDAEQRKATALSNQRNALDSIARSDEQGAVVSKPSTVTGDLSGVSVDGEEAGKRRRGKSLTRLLGI